MSRVSHLTLLGFYIVLTSAVLILLTYNGLSYYMVSQEERFYHPDNLILKSSGYTGHSLGIIGSLCIIIGVGSYMARKRYRFLSRTGLIKYWLGFHIFMCILGSILVVFHTAFKVGGLAAVSFWSMIIIFASGIAGRVIYLQIPRTMEGRELDLREVRDLRNSIIGKIQGSYNLDEDSVKFITWSVENRNSLADIKNQLRQKKLSRRDYSSVIALVRQDIRLGKNLDRLESLKNLFRHWHIFHLPFAILMLIFMVMHVVVTVALGYRWIF